MNSLYTNRFMKSCLQLFFISTFGIFFLLLFPSDISAQVQQVTGLGYVDTKATYKPLANYDPYKMVVDNNNNVVVIGELSQDYTSTYIPADIDLSWNSDGSAIYGGSSFFAKYSPQRSLLFAFTLGEGDKMAVSNWVQLKRMDVDSNDNIYIWII
jgi:hypothetical protein